MKTVTFKSKVAQRLHEYHRELANGISCGMYPEDILVNQESHISACKLRMDFYNLYIEEALILGFVIHEGLMLIPVWARKYIQYGTELIHADTGEIFKVTPGCHTPLPPPPLHEQMMEPSMYDSLDKVQKAQVDTWNATRNAYMTTEDARFGCVRYGMLVHQMNSLKAKRGK